MKNVFNDCTKEDLADDIESVTKELVKVNVAIEKYDPGEDYKREKFDDYLNQRNSCIVEDTSLKPSLVLKTMDMSSYCEMLSEFKIDLEELAEDRRAYDILLETKEMLEDTLVDFKEAQERILKMEETENGS